MFSPTNSRTLRTISPSASGKSSDTAAPCWAKNTASQGPLLRSKVNISSVRSVNAAFVIAEEGLAHAQIKGTISIEGSFLPAPKKPASDV